MKTFYTIVDADIYQIDYCASSMTSTLLGKAFDVNGHSTDLLKELTAANNNIYIDDSPLEALFNRLVEEGIARMQLGTTDNG